MSTPEAFYRNAIDLNRYSNSVAKKIVVSYNDIVLNTVERLRSIDELTAPQTAKRLRSLLAQLKESLANWTVDSSAFMTDELQGLALLQSEFVAEELKKVVPSGPKGDVRVRTVEVSPKFAKSVVTTDPTKINVFALPRELEDSVLQGGSPLYNLTAQRGSVITLPNGMTVEKAFRGLASSQADLFTKTVRSGLLAGEPTQQIARKLKGRLNFGQAGSVRQIAEQGGAMTRMANHQVMTIVRTSVNQVSNAAAQGVYNANEDITKKYEYVATLDSRTSAICGRLDGQTFAYGKGPTPPQHFNCRSTTVPVIDYEGLKKEGFDFDDIAKGQRPSESGMVPGDTTYADWLAKQPLSVQEKVFGKWKTQYFTKLSKQKGGPQSALRKIIKKDGSEKTLKQLQATYGKPPAFKPPKPEVPDVIKKTVANPDKAFKKASSKSLGKGAYGEAKLVSSRAGGVVVKQGRIAETEPAILKKLNDTGVSPAYYGFKTIERQAAISTTSKVTIKSGYLTMGRAKGKPVLKELLNDGTTLDDVTGMMDSYLGARKIIHLKGIAHNDMHGFNFFYDKKTKKGMAIDFGLAKNDPKAALIEAMGTGIGGRGEFAQVGGTMATIRDGMKTFGGDWQSKIFIESLEVIGPPGFLKTKDSAYKKFISNRKKVRSLLQKELDGPELMSRNIRERTDNLPGISDAKALKFLEMLYEGI